MKRKLILMFLVAYFPQHSALEHRITRSMSCRQRYEQQLIEQEAVTRTGVSYVLRQVPMLAIGTCFCLHALISLKSEQENQPPSSGLCDFWKQFCSGYCMCNVALCLMAPDCREAARVCYDANCGTICTDECCKLLGMRR